ncbi:predicted protein [Sclerotinia sclerotiorum 1980 UF-70]|uniref:Uncharacterized protein n=1 Tax=Sclerotinia sclerotiorum (strain ATCC 18683 / 1980 / Ss-1) TaxID=665079 RepID=A7ES23_SCLS1|nr:predicted protein [Sclerotinia sclerotiorum 1980 UF-70]EDN92265.1 predicted protein [Sclerotinia sclerotiorum 1980 UF-70]
MKLSQPLSIFAILAASTVAVAVPQDDACAQCLTEGTFCEGFAGPVGTCCDGLVDGSVQCLAKGETCVSIAGPVGTCCTGKCTFVAPDYSVCK